MPELPEVQTIVNDLRKFLPGLKIGNVQTDWEKMFLHPNFSKFKKEVIGEKILNIKRIGKNILIGLTGDKTILVHQKMTGHFLYGNWELKNGKWLSKNDDPIRSDPQNRFIHMVFDLSNGRQLALSDLRKFAKVLLCPTDKLNELEDIKNLGPDPTAKDFDFKKFKERLVGKKGKIKTVLMDQTVFAGIGNIYSDEILWLSGIHPLKPVPSLTQKELKTIFNSTKKILKRALEARGTSDSDYRDPCGKKGHYQEILYVYGLKGEKCQKNDGGVIQRIKVGSRSAHFCPVHQKLDLLPYSLKRDEILPKGEELR
ncbi:MAG: DNA-formamidopyrimidine glycosylase [Patescibacteria group bacterium]|nr:DNA-formamidopyrimidine glycosylase [Patescibacteria group bacterium]MDE2218595.1 DNA-formamidopyrimidine glycosylase [Patescibacteria group bacterium]